MTNSNHIYSAFAFIGFVLVTIPLPWHLEAWNTGTCLYMLWTGLACLNNFINSVVWDGNALNPAPIWCDISSRIIVMVAVAIPCASLCINRRLYHIASVTSVTTSKQQKRRAVMTDLAIGVGIPVLEGVLQYIPQGHRYNILEDIGCAPWTYSTPIAFVLVYTWPLIISIVSMVYCALTIRAFARRRLQFKQLLSTNNNLNTSRYLRLMCLAGVELLCGIPISSWFLALTVANGVEPWKGWEDTHSNFSRVVQYPSVLWRSDPQVVVAQELSRWSVVACAFIFFGFFGFADEARKNYRNAFSSVAKRMGYSTGVTTSTAGGRSAIANLSFTGGLPSLPVFVRKETTRTTDSTFDEKATHISISSEYNDEKGKPYSPTISSGSSASSINERDYLPPRPDPVFLSIPQLPRNAHDIV